MTGATLDQRFADAMGQLLGPDFPSDIGLAVSGGGDSMAMLYLAHNWTRTYGVRLWVVTIDHQLRAESADEAKMVAEECAALGWQHATVRWAWDGQGNVQDAGRRARLELIDRWRGVLRHVLMAHTRDDVAETFLMRLERGSGVGGLSAMAAKRTVSFVSQEDLGSDQFDGERPPHDDVDRGDGSFEIVRPCLDMTRGELRHYAKTLSGRWVEDPTNADETYLRVRMRRLLPLLAENGLGVDRLAETSLRMAGAKEALQARAVDVWRKIGAEGQTRWVPTGELLFKRTGFEEVERDTQLRLLSAALRFVATAEYAPRYEPLNALLERLLGGGGGTLHGCGVQMEKDHLRVYREFNAVKDLRLDIADNDASPELWDRRWALDARGIEGAYVRAVGQDGWEQISEKPGDAPPHASARSLPSLWVDGTLVSCDALGVGNGLRTGLWPMGIKSHSFERFLRNS